MVTTSLNVFPPEAVPVLGVVVFSFGAFVLLGRGLEVGGGIAYPFSRELWGAPQLGIGPSLAN